MFSSYTFSGHESFALRYPWIPKGVEAIRHDFQAFSKPNASTVMGVGKNMAKSIRFWCLATGIIEFSGTKGNLTPLGAYLFNYGSPSTSQVNSQLPAADPYLEFPGTLWLLHWQLVSTPVPASTWYLAFTCWNEVRFTRDDLLAWLLRCDQDSKRKTSISTIKRDIQVFLRTYVMGSKSQSHLAEDDFECPLGEIGLIRLVGQGVYSMERKERPSLPIEVLAYAICDFWDRTASTQTTISIERLLYGPGSPGSAFKINDRDFVRMLSSIPDKFGLHYDESAGQRLLLRESPLSNNLEILDQYYSVDHV